MRSIYSFLIVSFSVVIFGCTDAQTQTSKTNLSATEFDSRIKELPASLVIDVRTPGEFFKGHLLNAKNFDWNADSFEKQIAMLDKAKPVFVYCLSGARSSSAANKMISEGFKEVYQLDGGIMKWRASGLPETNDNGSEGSGISLQQFNELLSTDKLVLVDFYADWCEPCKLMKPYLDEISTERAKDVVLLSINADDNQALCKELKIDALPVLQVYKNKQLSWSNIGYIEKAAVVKQLQ